MQRRRFLKRAATALAAPWYPASGQLQAATSDHGRTSQEKNFSHPLFPDPSSEPGIDLSQAVVLTRPGQLPNAESTAAIVLREELAKRSGIHLKTSTHWPSGDTVIAITSEAEVSTWGRAIPIRSDGNRPEKSPEGYRLYVEINQEAPPVVWIIGADARGTLFGTGHLLRKVECSRKTIRIPRSTDLATAPVYPIRGHQLGYRATSNTYDAWDATQFEQYIRELTFFGANGIEGIPFPGDEKAPLVRFPYRQMSHDIGEICYRYDLDYWVWLPAAFDLKNSTLRTQYLDQSEQFFRDTRTLSAISFPGGDPGDNPPELIFPLLNDLAERMLPVHPEAKIWLSLQNFDSREVDTAFDFIDQNSPPWLGGLVVGPGSPPIGETRRRLSQKYRLRLYPDITHNELSQFVVPMWDQAFALTEGREAVNPRPVQYSQIFQERAGYSDGFISYSEGINDDVNKTIWSGLAWNPTQTVRDILLDYGRVYWNSKVSGESADGILALEKNWQGPLSTNGAVEGCLLRWQQLAKRAPQLEENWRWQLCLLRANYDAYIRHRLLHETELEGKANAVLLHASQLGSEAAMVRATEILNIAVHQPISVDLRTRILDLCDKLFHSIGLQTSVPKYHASGESRGAVLDFVDYPMNNRWWLEDEFEKIRALQSEEAKVRRLHELATWEHPGPGSFYDDLGNIDKSPHVVSCEPDIKLPGLIKKSHPGFWWLNNGKSRERLSWLVTMWPISMVYKGLDPAATYIVRITGHDAILSIQGERIQPIKYGEQLGDFTEFPVASKYIQGRNLILNWSHPPEKQHVVWWQRPRLSEVWLLKKS